MDHRRARWFLAAPLLLLVIFLVAACGSDDPGDPTDPTATPADNGSEPGNTPEPTGRDLEQYYSGETVTINVGFSPGGGYDTFSRMVAANISEYLPGSPEVIVVNLPGAGGERGLITTMQAEPDGKTLAILHPRFVRRELAGIDVPSFDVNTATVIGSPTGGVRVNRMLCSDPSIATEWQDVLDLGREINYGATEPGESGGLAVAFLEEVGAPVNIIFGYGGTSEVMAAFDRGELDASTDCRPDQVLRLYPEWVEEQRLVPLFWWEEPPTDEWVEQLGAPAQPPYVLDLPGMDFTADQRAVLEAMVALSTMDRIFVMPPGVDEDIVTAWREAFAATMDDPEFMAAAEAAGYTIGLATAEDFAAALTITDGISPEGMEMFTRLLGTD